MNSNNLLILEEYKDNSFKLVSDTIADIYYDLDDYKVVEIAAHDLASDIKRVAGKEIKVKHDLQNLSEGAVIIGTLDQSSIIDKLIKKNKINVDEIQGKWESFMIETIDNPLPGIEKALIIAGSDRRGTAFGVYELSQKIGVSPWYWWADVAIKQKNEIYIKNGRYIFGPPSVKYRGIFINDEDWGIQPWAANTYELENNDIGPRTYARIFELLLRLKANYIWPAMHGCTKPFNSFPENKIIADNYAIVVGSSHCEPMLRNNVTEWTEDIFKKYTDREWSSKDDSWNYEKNSDVIYRYWEERVKENSQYENTYTVGMRGIHDGGMPGPDGIEAKVNILNKVIKDQREILKEHVQSDVSQVPQIFCPYKEVLTLYENGLDLPEDITIVWVNDNYGYIRRLSDSDEQKRTGGAGIYYHISYFGRPHDYLWLCTTPPALIWEEMQKAYAYNARKLWVLNVGDIKPGELLTEFFLELAWDINSWNNLNLNEYLDQWAEREFTAEYQSNITEIMKEFYNLTYIRKPEHMGWNRIFPATPIEDPEFSLFNYGDEAEIYISRYKRIVQKAEGIYENISDKMKDSFYQLVLYPVKCSCLMAEKILYAYKSRVYAKQNRLSANDYAEKALMAYNKIKKETNYYNKELSDGKWNKIISYDPREQPVFYMPELGKVKPKVKSELGVSLEGDNEKKLPIFNTFRKEIYFIDLFNKGVDGIDWECDPSDDWIVLNKYQGYFNKEERIYLHIDKGRIPVETIIEGSIEIISSAGNKTIDIEVFNPDDCTLPNPGHFVECNGYLAIEAENYSNKIDKGGLKWDIIDGLGRTGKGAMTIFPVTADSFNLGNEIIEKSPCLEYKMTIFNPGVININLYCIPTHSIQSGRGLRYGIAFDNQEPIIVDVDANNGEFDKQWQKNVLRSTAITTTKHNIETKGKHVLKIWMVDPGVVIDRIVVNSGGLKKSYLGPSETVLE